MSDPTELDLSDLYRATIFRLEVPGSVIDIRVGNRHADLDALLQEPLVTEWAFITAWNPGSKLLSAQQNAARHEELIQIVRDHGYQYYGGAGIPDNPGWMPERSIWIAGIAKANAVELGRRFGQCVFRSMPATSSGACRAMIPVHAGPPFRSMPARGCDAD